ncbi:MAG: rod shape-determining protein MreD [Thermoleophilia bacterium]|nr:rod shape-determining protein MreD [Thermoleophilia bacterium]
MAAADAAKGAVLVLTAALLQVTVFASFALTAGTPNVLLLTVAALALLRGPIFGATAGFFGGLVADVATLETLGLTSLVLTVAGYWLGRYGETTGRDRAHAPVLAVFVATALYAVGTFSLLFVLGDVVSGRELVRALLPSLVLNTLAAVPVHALCRRLLAPAPPPERAREVTLLG